MAFKFSSKDRTIRIYNLRADTREFIGAGMLIYRLILVSRQTAPILHRLKCQMERLQYSTEQSGSWLRTIEIKTIQ